jgi:transcriptional regulator with XRE-family HTH domain
MTTNNIEKLEFFRIFAHADVQPRAEIHQETVNEYAEEMRQGAKFPPVVVFRDDDVFYWLADGFHRFEAAQKAGRPFIQAEIRAGGKREAILYAVGANASHGLRRSREDKRNSVLKLLKDEQWSQWSDREIARRCQVSPDTVNRIRRSLSESDSENETRSYRTKHGTVATMNTRNIGRQRQRDQELEKNQRELEEAIKHGEVDLADIPVRFESAAGSPHNEQANSVEHLVSLYKALSYEEKQSFLEILNLAEKATDPVDEQQSIVAVICEKTGLTEDQLREKIRWFFEGFYEEEELAEEFGISTEQVMQLYYSQYGSERPWGDEEDHTAQRPAEI